MLLAIPTSMAADKPSRYLVVFPFWTMLTNFAVINAYPKSTGSSTANETRHRAATLPGSDWSERKTDESDQALHVESVLDHQKEYDSSTSPQSQIKEYQLKNGNSENFRYMILSADLNSRVGRVLPQPWFTGADQMLQADLCSDWVEPIKFIVENDGLGSEDFVAAMGWEPSRNDNVIEFIVCDFDQKLEESNS
jgi:hypothetical protein